MAITDLILDFDGTLTDTEAEAAPMISRWNELICAKSGMSLDELHAVIPITRQSIQANAKSGWVNGGVVVAPAVADPYVFHTSVLQEIIGVFSETFNFPKPGADREAFLSNSFLEAYPCATTVFREGAKEFLQTVKERYNVKIVTNSRTDAVLRKLDLLGENSFPVLGQAKKYVVDSDFTEVPESVDIRGFPRPVMLRRKNYHAILQNFDASKTAVVGDIYELDLALPEHLRFRTIQIETPSTPLYEKERHVNGSPTKFARSYGDVSKFLEK